jgi:hypothetical protein
MAKKYFRLDINSKAKWRSERAAVRCAFAAMNGLCACHPQSITLRSSSDCRHSKSATVFFSSRALSRLDRRLDRLVTEDVGRCHGG